MDIFQSKKNNSKGLFTKHLGFNLLVFSLSNPKKYQSIVVHSKMLFFVIIFYKSSLAARYLKNLST